VLLLWERASDVDRARLERLVREWPAGAMLEISHLLSRYDTLEPSLKSVQHYLERAKEAIGVLPEPGRAGLIGLTDYLARQTESLGMVPESGL